MTRVFCGLTDCKYNEGSVFCVNESIAIVVIDGNVLCNNYKPKSKKVKK